MGELEGVVVRRDGLRVGLLVGFFVVGDFVGLLVLVVGLLDG